MRSSMAGVLAGLTLLMAAPVAAQQGVTDTEIVTGCSNSFSGPLAFTGEQATKFGVDLYFKVVNDAGGIHGRKVRTVYYDDGYKPQEAVANTKKLVVVMASHENFRALDDLRSLMGYHVTAKIGDPDQIDKLVAKHYQTNAEGLGEVLSEMQSDENLAELPLAEGFSIPA